MWICYVNAVCFIAWLVWVLLNVAASTPELCSRRLMCRAMSPPLVLNFDPYCISIVSGQKTEPHIHMFRHNIRTDEGCLGGLTLNAAFVLLRQYTVICLNSIPLYHDFEYNFTHLSHEVVCCVSKIITRNVSAFMPSSVTASNSRNSWHLFYVFNIISRN